MKRLGLILLWLTMLFCTPAQADWRWAPPKLKKQAVRYSCDTLKCLRQTYFKERQRFQRRIKLYDQRRLHEWNYWTHQYIPACTWYGESGTGPIFAPIRYVTPNAQGSGAYGKFQFMPGTYHTFAKYHDWSPLDQEIAGHRAYWAHGTSPWANC